ncbi:ATP-binding protein [Pseudazoarcus pumilus]|uniref:histidine kinase n=1 Tax=Pseudazoarcus pumilus TaxID=2067960 RepID=A0A2I6S7G6_9RHOO|nr:ATP-binding protein [Pseudazoarcus pumilus]AUN95182.1 two-component sensor histidine kinase [Pseudazoarcus pumilus]
MRSIRSRVMFSVLGLLAVALTVLSAKGYLDARHETEELFDAQLARSARLISGMLDAGFDPGRREAVQRALDAAISRSASAEAGHRYETKLAFLLLDADGTVLLESASAPAGLRDTLPGARVPPGYHDVRAGGHRWRVFALGDDSGRQVLVAEREDVRGELIGSITLRGLLPDAVGLPLIALLVWLAISWGLKPLANMVAMIRARDPERLTPLTLAPLPAELEPVVAALNRLLTQVDTVLARERRFIADAAHELRTPLAVLRIHAQNAADAADPADREEALGHLRAGVDRATRVISQLLTLARLEPEGGVQRAPVDLRAFVRAELAELVPLALQRQQEVSFEAPEGGDYHACCDAGSIGILLQNLIGNAVQYAPQGGTIRVALEPGEQVVRILVEDNGTGVPEAVRHRLTERFFRAGAGAGAGLGLAIVQRIVHLHGGNILFGEAKSGGLRVVVALPREATV